MTLWPLYGVDQLRTDSGIQLSDLDSAQLSSIQNSDVDHATIGSQVQQWRQWVDEQIKGLEQRKSHGGGGHQPVSCLTQDQLQAVIQGSDDIRQKLTSLNKEIFFGHAFKGQESTKEKRLKYEKDMRKCNDALKQEKYARIHCSVMHYKKKRQQEAAQSVSHSVVCASMKTGGRQGSLLSSADASSDVTPQDYEQYDQYLKNTKEKLEKSINRKQDAQQLARYKKKLKDVSTSCSLLGEYIKICNKKQQYEHALWKYDMSSRCATLVKRNDDLQNKAQQMVVSESLGVDPLSQQPATLMDMMNCLKGKLNHHKKPDSVDQNQPTDKDKEMQEHMMQQWKSMMSISLALQKVESKQFPPKERTDNTEHQKSHISGFQSPNDIPLGKSIIMTNPSSELGNSEWFIVPEVKKYGSLPEVKKDEAYSRTKIINNYFHFT